MTKKNDTRRLLFGKGALAPILDGVRSCTIRKFRREAHNLAAGERFTGVFVEGRNVELVCTHDTICIEADRLSDANARTGGFANAAECLDALAEHYPDLTDQSVLALIRFKLAEKKSS